MASAARNLMPCHDFLTLYNQHSRRHKPRAMLRIYRTNIFH